MGVIIYGLIDPRYLTLFYVGKTEGKLQDRVRVHKGTAKENKKTKVARTIRGILLAGLEPDAFVIETVSKEHWIEAEQFWIAYFKSIGCNLANHTAGGEGLSGMKHSPEAIEKTRQANLGSKKSEETKALIKASWTDERKAVHIAFCKTRVMSDPQREFLSNLHKNKVISAEQRVKLSIAGKGRVQTKEWKLNSGAGVKRAAAQRNAMKQAAIHCSVLSFGA